MYTLYEPELTSRLLLPTEHNATGLGLVWVVILDDDEAKRGPQTLAEGQGDSDQTTLLQAHGISVLEIAVHRTSVETASAVQQTVENVETIWRHLRQCSRELLGVPPACVSIGGSSEGAALAVQVAARSQLTPDRPAGVVLAAPVPPRSQLEPWRYAGFPAVHLHVGESVAESAYGNLLLRHLHASGVTYQAQHEGEASRDGEARPRLGVLQARAARIALWLTMCGRGRLSSQPPSGTGALSSRALP